MSVHQESRRRLINLYFEDRGIIGTPETIKEVIDALSNTLKVKQWVIWRDLGTSDKQFYGSIN
jgi:hypothetical protein